MFETLEARVARAATRLARRRAAALAEEMRGKLPGDIEVEAGRGHVRLSGPGLGRRRALDAELRWTVAGSIL